MAKKLIVCCDGTWNWPEQKGGPTNVIKMVRAITPADEAGRPQVVYYHPGVGTGNWLDRLVGGGFGIGLSRNVQDAYQFVVNNYEDGDALYLFGFSRGAFTVRSLAGLIGCVGLLRKGDMDQFPQAYRFYQTPPERRSAAVREALLGKTTHRRHPEIEMIGVWDTVGALGVPFGMLRWVGRRLYRFHNTELGVHIRHAYQALAIDEHRRPFAPAVWTKPANPPQGERERRAQQVLEQVWFAGAHANVGGGYPDRGLSDLAFLWMVGKAVECGLAVDRAYVGAKVRKEMRASKLLLVESRRGAYRVWPPLFRPVCSSSTGNERVHRSAVQRMAAGTNGKFVPLPYDPPNLRALGDGLAGLVVEPHPEYEARDGHPGPAVTAEQRQDAETDAEKV